MYAQGIGGIVPILMYHSISRQTTPAYQPFIISPDLFVEHIEHLRQHNYTPITVTQLAQARSQNMTALPERPVVLTFDDGLADFYHSAFPVLRQYNYRATLYIVTAYVNGTSQWLRSKGEEMRPMLSWEQIQEIDEQGIECGGHSRTHRQLDILSAASARDEIVRCKEELESHIQRKILTFSYPYGYYTIGIQRMVSEAGYTSACTVQNTASSPNDSPFALTRLNIDSSVDTTALEALLNRKETRSSASRLRRALAYGWRLKRRFSALVDDWRGEGYPLSNTEVAFKKERVPGEGNISV